MRNASPSPIIGTDVLSVCLVRVRIADLCARENIARYCIIKPTVGRLVEDLSALNRAGWKYIEPPVDMTIGESRMLRNERIISSSVDADARKQLLTYLNSNATSIDDRKSTSKSRKGFTRIV